MTIQDQEIKRKRERLEQILARHPSIIRKMKGKRDVYGQRKGKKAAELVKEAQSNPELKPIFDRLGRVNAYKNKADELVKRKIAGEKVSQKEIDGLFSEGKNINADYQELVRACTDKIKKSELWETHIPSFMARPESVDVMKNIDKYFTDDERKEIGYLGLDLDQTLSDMKLAYSAKNRKELARLNRQDFAAHLDKFAEKIPELMLPESPDMLSKNGVLTFGGNMGWWSDFVDAVVTVVAVVAVIVAVVVAIVVSPIVAAAVLIGGALFIGALLLGEVIVDALTGVTTPAGNIKHVFVLMLENRSFDHMFGLSGISGTGTDGQPTTIDGAQGFYNLKDLNDPASKADTITGAPYNDYFPQVDPPHEFNMVMRQVAGPGATLGAGGEYPVGLSNGGFIVEHGKDRHKRDGADDDIEARGSTTPEEIMQCFGPGELPYLHRLAKEYALCDNWFCSMPGPTMPNRFFVHAATSGGLTASPSSLDLFINFLFTGYSFENGNIYERLDEKDCSWRVFHDDAFPGVSILDGMTWNRLKGRFSDFDELAHEINEDDFDETYIFVEPDYGNLVTGEIYLDGNSMHARDKVGPGDKLAKDFYETIRNSPVWNDSALVITWDEHGGFPDHVTSPATTAPGDEAHYSGQFNFKRLGVRVPAIIISPYTPKNTIDHTQYDHSSIISSVLKLVAGGHLTERDRNASDFLHLFSLQTQRTDAPTHL